MGDSNYVNNTLPAQLALLDEVRYFGITVNSSGGLTTTATNLSHIQTILQKINALPAAQRPRLDITLGGAGESEGFAAVAQSTTLRSTLATNIDALLDQTGAVGVDLDWEHPAEGVELTTRYPAMLSRIKQELGPSRRVYATVSPEKILPRSVFEGDNAIDGVSLMTYDIGWWANDSADPNLGQHSLPEYVVDSVNAWTNPAGASIPRTYVFGSKKSIDAPESMLGVGSPFYGRGYNGSSSGLAVAYRDLKATGTTADGSAYLYQGSNVWLPGPALIDDRIEFADQRGLQHVIFWELWHDLAPSNPQSLLRTAYDAKVRLAAARGDFNADDLVDAADLATLSAGFGAPGGPAAGDANGDGSVDGADFLIWQQHLKGASPAANAVPEPCGALLVAAGFSALAGRRRAPRLGAGRLRDCARKRRRSCTRKCGPISEPILQPRMRLPREIVQPRHGPPGKTPPAKRERAPAEEQGGEVLRGGPRTATAARQRRVAHRVRRRPDVPRALRLDIRPRARGKEGSPASSKFFLPHPCDPCRPLTLRALCVL